MRGVFRHLSRALIVIVLASMGTFMLANMTPGDPAYVVLGETATPAQVKAVHEELGYDLPLPVRYFEWAKAIVTRGDFGKSLISHQPIVQVIAKALPVTLELALIAWVLALLISIPAGIYSAFRAGGWFDRLATATASAMIASPVFLTALLLIYAFAMKAGVLPVFGWVPLADGLAPNLTHIALPAFALALYEAPSFMRVLRSDMIATLQEDFVLFARAKGLPKAYILLRHALRPSSLSLITLMGLSLGRLIGGVIVVEILFALPGLGQALIMAVNQKDISTVLGISTCIAIVYVMINTSVDLIYMVVDPRVKIRQ